MGRLDGVRELSNRYYRSISYHRIYKFYRYSNFSIGAERDIDDRGVSINNENKSTISLKILGIKLVTNW